MSTIPPSGRKPLGEYQQDVLGLYGKKHWPIFGLTETPLKRESRQEAGLRYAFDMIGHLLQRIEVLEAAAADRPPAGAADAASR